ncbi:hypothetical protein [Lutibaculum baratangense]|uniref:Uncharacterized protein n=1 Tax=Lutibaculum baratangense AMV1 TaxID=631454 RepID=V4RGS0_9HYPH|nr:hypothetical protein [Lutibaculum baratangense]ESR24554.1 hypothetical protein N177_2388 [Lutibaculum baratangense AMV1]
MNAETKPRHPEQLRHAIDRGEGGDKVAYPDPAASPLGTDEEAGGNPSSPEATATAYRQEVRSTPRESSRGDGSRGLLIGLWAVLAAVVAAFLVFFFAYGG